MKTPRQATQVQAAPRQAPTQAAFAPWGAAKGLRVVETPARGQSSSTRALLKQQVDEDYPEGKATARRRYFGQQRGLPAHTKGSGVAATNAALPLAHTKAAAKAAAEIATKAATKAATKTATKVASKVANNAAGLTPGTKPAPVMGNDAQAFATAAKSAQPVWRDLGPTLIPHGQTYGEGEGAMPAVSGRVCGLVVDRSNPHHLVLCSAGGGLWGSLDRGATWAPLTDEQPTLVMGAIAQAASAPAILYAATGDGDGQIPYGVGLLRSADAGRSWALVPSAALTGRGCFDLAVHPNKALTVFVAADTGLFRSVDGGQTVQRLRAHLCWSVSLHPSQPNEVLACFGAGLLRSTDGGASWVAVKLPQAPVGMAFDRLEVCHAPSDGGVVYVAGAAGGQAMLWRRSKLGGAFHALNTPARMDVDQAFYDWCLAVSPHDPGLLMLGAVELYRGQLGQGDKLGAGGASGSGGMAWRKVSSRKQGDSIHPDQHFVVFDPATPGRLYACNDGGVFGTHDLGEHWQSLNPGLGITEFEFLAQLESQADWLFGGTQDNGSLAMAGPRLWNQVALGDGGDCAALDRGAASVVFHSFYNMPLERAPALGANAFAWQGIGPRVPKDYVSQFYPPMEAREGLLVKAGRSVWASADDGEHWSQLLLPTSGDEEPDLATAMAIVDEHTLLVGMMSGRLWRAVRGGTHGTARWADASLIELAQLPGYVSDIVVTDSLGQALWLACSRLGVGHVFRSTDGGQTLLDRSANLPDLAVNALVVDPLDGRRLYAATDRGVWRTQDAGVTWASCSQGLPNVIVGDLILHQATRRLRAGTRGRGAWELQL